MELKDILSKAQVAVPARSTKADLVAKILASPKALAVFQGNAGPGAQGEIPGVAPPVETIEMVNTYPFFLQLLLSTAMPANSIMPAIIAGVCGLL